MSRIDDGHITHIFRFDMVTGTRFDGESRSELVWVAVKLKDGQADSVMETLGRIMETDVSALVATPYVCSALAWLV